MKIVLFGPPAAGKGTQAGILGKKYNIPVISTGAIIRHSIEAKTPFGIKAEKFINDGKLITDDLMIEIVLERINKEDCKNGYVLDGFPRTLVQSKAFDRLGIVFDYAIFINVDDEEVIKRILGRSECPICSSSYHDYYNPSSNGGFCDKCGACLERRKDDTKEIVRKRLAVYHEQTEPILEFYKQKNNLVTVNSMENIEDTSKLLLKMLKD